MVESIPRMERLGPFRQTLSSERVPFQNGRTWPSSKFHFETAISNVIGNCSIYERFLPLSLLEHCVLSLWVPGL